MGNFFEVTGSGGSEGKVDFKLKGTANLVLENSNTLPVSGMVEGQVYWKSNTDELYVFNGSAWQLISATGGTSFPLLAPDGSTSAPSYSFSSSSNSGLMYNSGGPSIQLIQNGGVVLTTGTSGHRLALQPPADPTNSFLIAADIGIAQVSSPLTFVVASSTIKFGTSNQLALTASNPGATGRSINLPDPGTATADAVITQADQSILGNKSFQFFRATPQIGGDANAHVVLQVDGTGSHTWDIHTTNGSPNTLIFTNWGFARSSTLNALQQLTIGDTLTLATGTGSAAITTANTAAHTYTIPTNVADSFFMMTEGTQTINGSNTFTADTTVSRAANSADVTFTVANGDGVGINTNAVLLLNTASSNSDPLIKFKTGASVKWTVGCNGSQIGHPASRFTFSAHDGFETNDVMILTTANEVTGGLDNTISLGTSAIRWSDVYGVTIHSGDIELENKWRITEGDKAGHPEEGIVILSPDGKKFKLAMTQID